MKKSLLEIVKDSEKTKDIWRENQSSTEWRNANKLNILLFGMPLNDKPKCKCIEDLFFMLKSNNINQKFNQKMEQQFKVKKGKVISSFAFGFQLTEHSGDEQIKEALKLQPNLINLMDVYPENWKVVVGLEKPAKGTVTAKKTAPKKTVTVKKTATNGKA